MVKMTELFNVKDGELLILSESFAHPPTICLALLASPEQVDAALRPVVVVHQKNPIVRKVGETIELARGQLVISLGKLEFAPQNNGSITVTLIVPPDVVANP